MYLCRSSPAPLTQCTASNFDLVNDTRLCLPERSALNAFYETSKGQEWTVDELWLDEYKSHCLWYGVECSGNSVIKLELSSNGLSGTLSEKIGDLSSLEVLDLSDNGLKVGATCSSIDYAIFSYRKYHHYSLLNTILLSFYILYFSGIYSNRDWCSFSAHCPQTELQLF